jgi:hypothetical protein
MQPFSSSTTAAGNQIIFTYVHQGCSRLDEFEGTPKPDAFASGKRRTLDVRSYPSEITEYLMRSGFQLLEDIGRLIWHGTWGRRQAFAWLRVLSRLRALRCWFFGIQDGISIEENESTINAQPTNKIPKMKGANDRWQMHVKENTDASLVRRLLRRSSAVG